MLLVGGNIRWSEQRTTGGDSRVINDLAMVDALVDKWKSGSSEGTNNKLISSIMS